MNSPFKRYSTLIRLHFSLQIWFILFILLPILKLDLEAHKTKPKQETSFDEQKLRDEISDLKAQVSLLKHGDTSELVDTIDHLAEELNKAQLQKKRPIKS